MIVTRYYWNTPLCQPNPCSPCTCNAYDDVVSESCCSCLGCYPAGPAFFSPPAFFGPPGFFSPPAFFGPPGFFAPPAFK